MAPGQLPQPGNLNCRKDRQRRYFQQGPKVAFNSEKQLTDVSLLAARKLYVVFLELFLYSTQHVGSVSSCEFVNLFQHLPELNMNYGIAKSALCSFFYTRRKCMILWSKRNIYMLAVGKCSQLGLSPRKKILPPNPAFLLPSNFGNFWAVEFYLVHVVFLCIFINYFS